MAETEQDLKSRLEKMEEVMGTEYMKIRKIKTEVMICGKDENIRTSLIVNNGILQNVKKCIYLESRITKYGRSSKEIRERE